MCAENEDMEGVLIFIATDCTRSHCRHSPHDHINLRGYRILTYLLGEDFSLWVVLPARYLTVRSKAGCTMGMELHGSG
jgi:hypothetical protein